MKSLFVISALILIFFSTTALAEECENKTIVNLNLASYEYQGLTKEIVSRYIFPDFKEGSFLSVKTFSIKNAGNCSFPESHLDISAYSPSPERKEYLLMSITVPALQPDENYSISVVDSYNNRYLDSLGKYHNWYKIPLTKIGTWNITFDWNRNASVPMYDYIENSFLKEFSVLSRYDIDIRGGSVFSLLAQWVAIIVAIITPIGILIFQIRRESSRWERNQIGYLENIVLRVNKILNDLEGFREEIIKQGKPYCPYDMKYINSDYYEVFLDSRIDGKSTREIKAKLILIDDKIKMINKHNISHNRSETMTALKIIGIDLMKELTNLKKTINKGWLNSEGFASQK